MTYLEDDTEDMSVHKPELGIYNTREWDANYRNWLHKNGENPGQHPDPKCVWNQNFENFKLDEY